MRVDLIVEFFVRVISSRESVSTAVRTLGARIRSPANFKEIVQSRFVDAISAVAERLTMAEIHVGRTKFMEEVKSLVAERLSPNRLELEYAWMVSFEQTDISVFDLSTLVGGVVG
jgi:uncharacterized membrane protein YqiK